MNIFERSHGSGHILGCSILGHLLCTHSHFFNCVAHGYFCIVAFNFAHHLEHQRRFFFINKCNNCCNKATTIAISIKPTATATMQHPLQQCMQRRIMSSSSWPIPPLSNSFERMLLLERVWMSVVSVIDNCGALWSGLVTSDIYDVRLCSVSLIQQQLWEETVARGAAGAAAAAAGGAAAAAAAAAGAGAAAAAAAAAAMAAAAATATDKYYFQTTIYIRSRTSCITGKDFV